MRTILLLNMAIATLLISVAMLLVVVAVLLVTSALLLLIALTLLLRTVFSMMMTTHTMVRTHLLISLILVFRKNLFQFLLISLALFEALFQLSFLLIREFRTLSAFFVLTSTLVHLRARTTFSWSQDAFVLLVQCFHLLLLVGIQSKFLCHHGCHCGRIHLTGLTAVCILCHGHCHRQQCHKHQHHLFHIHAFFVSKHT